MLHVRLVGVWINVKKCLGSFIINLKWQCLHKEHVSIKQRYCIELKIPLSMEVGRFLKYFFRKHCLLNPLPYLFLDSTNMKCAWTQLLKHLYSSVEIQNEHVCIIVNNIWHHRVCIDIVIGCEREGAIEKRLQFVFIMHVKSSINHAVFTSGL